jgi:hypothetical protein
MSIQSTQPSPAKQEKYNEILFKNFPQELNKKNFSIFAKLIVLLIYRYLSIKIRENNNKLRINFSVYIFHFFFPCYKIYSAEIKLDLIIKKMS